VSVQEIWSISVNGPADELTIGARCADAIGAKLRWAAVWSPAEPSAITTRFGEHLHTVEGASMVVLPSPALDDARALLMLAGAAPVCVHWSPRIHVDDTGGDAPWISFVDPLGVRRDDARVYGIELAGNAAPLTTSDRPSAPDFVFGPSRAIGWALHLVAIRDHLPALELQSRLAAAASVATGLVRRVSRP